MNYLLKSATIIDDTSKFHQKKMDVLIEDGIITQIAINIKSNPNFKEINFENLHISQGWFDSSVCFGEPGFEERETIHNGLITAAKSGFTSVAVNSNTNPVTDSKAAIEFLKNKATKTLTQLYPIGAFTKNSEGKDLAELFDMQNSGAIAFGDYNKSISNANLLKIGLLYAQNFNGLILSFPQEDAIALNGLVNEHINSTKYGLKGIPALAEELQITRDLFILEYTGGKLHIPTISTKNSVKLIKEAKNKGLQVTCSVAAHHLVLNDDEIKNFDTHSKIIPPLRTLKDQKALLKGLKDGTIDVITSDHNPIDIEHKKLEYEKAKFGTIGLESCFGAVNQVLDLETTIKCLTINPSKIFDIPTSSIKVGNKANITLFNPNETYIFKKEHILSTSKNSVFLNKKLKGKVYGVIANNKSYL
jgi:dihydroorotase